MKQCVLISLLALCACSTDNILTPEQQLKKDLATIDKYLEKNGIVATKDPSGLRIVVHSAGSGLPPGFTAKLTVKYQGRFLNGDIFTDVTTPQTYTTPLDDLIMGWQIGFRYLGKGGKATLYIPSTLGYGRTPNNGLPSNANLIFDVELIGYTN